MADVHANFAYSTVKVAPSPATTGTSLTVQDGDSALFPNPPFNATVWPTSSQPTSANAEIVRVIAINDDVFTLLDNDANGSRDPQESSSSRSIVVGDQIAAIITNKTLTDAEATPKYYSPFVLASGAASGLQTLASASGQSSTASLFVFPVTIPQNLIFNEILLANSLSFITTASNETIANSYYSKYGIYSMNANTLSLISSNSFSIGETVSSTKLTWNFPTTTHTTGYGYGSFSAGNLTAAAQISSYIQSTRLIGLQFGGNLTMSGGVYWIGLMSQRSTAVHSTYGLSNAGIIGQPIANINQVGTASGLLPIGIANSTFSGTNNSHLTQWWGRYIVGFFTSTGQTGFGGSVIPSIINLSELAGGGAASSATILPNITFVST